MLPADFLKLAERLLASDKSPAGYRSAVSRAYYAVFHEAVAFLEKAPGVHIKSDATGHADVTHHLVNLSDPELEQLGHDISTMRGLRNDADYKLKAPTMESEKTVKGIVQQAKDYVAILDTCCRDTQRHERVKRAIKSRHLTLRGRTS